jgi:hypothetical protein
MCSGSLVNGDLRIINLFFKAMQEESDQGVQQNIHEGMCSTTSVLFRFAHL